MRAKENLKTQFMIKDMGKSRYFLVIEKSISFSTKVCVGFTIGG